MTGIHEVKHLLEEQTKAFEAFKHENDQKTGRNGDAIVRINGELDRIGDRLDATQTALDRAPRSWAEESGHMASPERKVFTRFLRKGMDGMAPDEVKVLTVSDDTGAGYLAPAEYVREIIKSEAELSPIRSVAQVRQTSQRSLEIPRRTGQFSAVWVGEIETRSETTGYTVGLEEVAAHELMAEVYLSNQMIEDAVFNIEQELGEEFSERFAVAEGAAFVDGNGVKQPEGFLANTDVGETVSGSAATIADTNGQGDGVIDLFYGIKTAYGRNGTWLLNRNTLASVRKLKDTNNQYIWQPGMAPGQANSILGAPYVEVPDMPDEAADAYPMAYGDWRRGYLIVDRITMSVLRDPYTRASQGQVKFVARRRVGGQVVLAEAMRKLKCSV